jgi:6-phosphogluconolactonase
MGTESTRRAILYVGAFTGDPPHTYGKAKGISVFAIDTETGTLSFMQTVEDVPNPSFLTLAPDGRHLYSVNANAEIDGHPGGALSAFAVNQADGTLTFLNREAVQSAGPCHVTVDRTGRWALATSYHGGSAAVLPIREDGRLGPATDVVYYSGTGPHPVSQQAPHAHSVNLDPSNRFAFICNQGLDRVYIYRFDAERGRLIPHPDQPYATTDPATGPRHLAFHPNGRYVYVVNEQGGSVTAFELDPVGGTLRTIQTISTLPADYTGPNACADIHMHPNGQFVYGSNRGHDSLAIFAVDEASGLLSAIGHQPTLGQTPRNFTLIDGGARLLVANQGSDSIVLFDVDSHSGRLASRGRIGETPTPSCLLWVAAK